MLQTAHILLMSLYIILPPVMLAAIFAFRGRGPGGLAAAWPSVTVAVATSMLLGVSASIIYDLWLGGFVSPAQMILTCYWAAGLICILKILDFLLDGVTRLAFSRLGSWTPNDRRSGAQVVRVILLFLIGLPYMLAAASSYRPRLNQGNPSPWLNAGAQRVTFAASDGMRIAGYFTPAPTARHHAASRWGHQTLIICPGSRGGKAAYFNLAREFLDGGYNVLTFDFRGHGQSEGQIDSFGDHERRDVLGAVRWLQDNEPAGSRRIVGIGIDTGGAALLAAGADPSPQGQAIEALAVLGCYDRFNHLAAVSVFPPPLRWLVLPVAVPLACVQTGAHLWDFSPANDAYDIGPRPILFIHDTRNPVIPFELGENLYDTADFPKSHIWLDHMTEEQAADDPAIAGKMRQFLDTAIPML